MSSPGARQRRRRQQYQSPRTRAEIVAAVGAAFAIVAGTALMIWLLRPGGLADRQPRSSWLVGVVLIVSAILLFEVLRPKTPVKKLTRQVSLGGGFGVIAVVAVVAGFVWPGGLLRHTPRNLFPTVPTANPLTSTSALVPLPSSTAIPGTTVAPGGTTVPGATTVPTAAPGATGSSQTTAPNLTTTSGSPPPVSPSP